MNGYGRLLEDQLRHTSQIGARRVTQVGQRLARLAGQHVQGLTVGAGLGIGGQRLLAQGHHLVALGIELERLRRMVVGDQHVAAALHQPHHRVVHVQRDQAALERAEVLAQAGHPGRKEGEGQRVRHGELDHVAAGAGVRAHHRAGVLQRLQHLQRLVVQGEARGREAGGVGAAVHQIGAGPGLQGLDAARKRRLRHVPQLRRAAEAARLGQTDEVFEPFGFHGAHYRAAARVPLPARAVRWGTPCAKPCCI